MITVHSKPELIDIIRVCFGARQDEREQYEAFSGEAYDYQKMAMALACKSGPSWLLCVDGEPIVVAGFDYVRKGVWQDWLVSTDLAWVKANWFGVTRVARRAMDKMLENEAHRLQCVSLRSRIHAHKWYRALGLRQEGLLESYGADGEDALMFARVKQ